MGYPADEGIAVSLVSAGVIYPRPIHSVKAGFVIILAYRLTGKALKEIFKED